MGTDCLWGDNGILKSFHMKNFRYFIQQNSIIRVLFCEFVENSGNNLFWVIIKGESKLLYGKIE